MTTVQIPKVSVTEKYLDFDLTPVWLHQWPFTDPRLLSGTLLIFSSTIWPFRNNCRRKYNLWRSDKSLASLKNVQLELWTIFYPELLSPFRLWETLREGLVQWSSVRLNITISTMRTSRGFPSIWPRLCWLHFSCVQIRNRKWSFVSFIEQQMCFCFYGLANIVKFNSPWSDKIFNF